MQDRSLHSCVDMCNTKVDIDGTTGESQVNDSNLRFDIEENKQKKPSASLASNLSMVVNILLLITKILVFILTFSFAVIASLVDSVLDILSLLIIYITVQKAKNFKQNDEFPVGKTRLEPIGVLTFSILMTMLSAVVIYECIQSLILANHKVDSSTVALGLLCGVILLKFLLWVYCRQFKESATAQALAQDHINDVFSNAVALVVAAVAARWPKYTFLDPTGAICISVYIIYAWVNVAREETQKLIGLSADQEQLDELTEICEKHDGNGCVLNWLKAYHIGRNVLCEVDMIMSENTSFIVAHDSGMELQAKLEQCEFVERAFVNCDYKKRENDKHKKPTLA